MWPREAESSSAGFETLSALAFKRRSDYAFATMKAHLIANSQSGHGKGSELADEARAVCRELRTELVEYPIQSPEDIEPQSRVAVENDKLDDGVVIAAGGDGTIRTVAEIVQGTGVKFAVVPCGTFNFFARTHRVPEDHVEALRLAVSGEALYVRVGEMNGRIFLINASLGLYAQAIHDRELRTKRFGRNRLVVILSTLFSFLNRRLLMRTEVAVEGTVRSVYTPMIFIGNNALQLRDLSLSVAQCMQVDQLAVVMMKTFTTTQVLGVILHGIFKDLENEKRLETFCVEEMTIYTRKRWHKIALDGELFTMSSPLKIRALPQALRMVLPPKESAK